jgi:hypothetical protein
VDDGGGNTDSTEETVTRFDIGRELPPVLGHLIVVDQLGVWWQNGQSGQYGGSRDRYDVIVVTVPRRWPSAEADSIA